VRVRGARLTPGGSWTIATQDGQNRHLTNSAEAEPVRPVPLHAVAADHDPEGTIITATLPPLSWTALRLDPVGV
jgi:alpha-N-arabinofuranosidase